MEILKGGHRHQRAVGHVPVFPSTSQQRPVLAGSGAHPGTPRLSAVSPQEPGRRAELSRILGELEVAEPCPESGDKGEDLLALMDAL